MNRFKELRFWLKHALWFVPCAYLLNFIYAIQSDQSGGTFGDTFGAANALFSGTALLMLVLAVSLQREELEEVRKERNDTRKLLEGQEELNELQKEALERQNFTQTFNSLLNSALQEKNRLAIRPVVDGRLGQSEYSSSSFFCASLLEKVAVGVRTELILQDSINKLANKNYFYVCMLVHLTNLVDRNNEAEDMASLLRSLFDEECAYCLAWYIVKSTILNEKNDHLLGVFSAFEMIEMLDDVALNGFLKTRPDYAELA
ncbi:hypothetical protein I5192_01335 [Ruegeria sp. SCSIO 43209]|uniref:hypothetical protein n=1 Tax=Ruegeria sp. SCSIO 43209 TaxID=2793010 RepID=UPI001CA9BA0E|nr:hypothetical protein [Ruegeria sp. SCSIO 43209]UAB89360.1 hypothetical protein I5192_01335 [Ruegeria sp. SCSIO 43209]